MILTEEMMRYFNGKPIEKNDKKNIWTVPYVNWIGEVGYFTVVFRNTTSGVIAYVRFDVDCEIADVCSFIRLIYDFSGGKVSQLPGLLP